ncbi:MAG: hypothetical protein J6S87_05450 [Bacteroidales bacterium]|nr:hypothetical protein [Bacteroidales bacterium]
MKMRHFMILAVMMVMTISAKAISYEEAKDDAFFLTDKMAYELSLTEDQYDAVYEINLDYLLCLNKSADLFGVYWDRRNADRIHNKPASPDHHHAPAAHGTASAAPAPNNNAKAATPNNNPATPNNSARPTTPNNNAQPATPNNNPRPTTTPNNNPRPTTTPSRPAGNPGGAPGGGRPAGGPGGRR